MLDLKDPKVRRLVVSSTPVEKLPPKKRIRPRTKVSGWEKGVVRTACFYVSDPYHQAVSLASSRLKTSNGILVEAAVREYLRTNPGLEGIRAALAAILGVDWEGEEAEPEEDEEGQDEE